MILLTGAAGKTGRAILAALQNFDTNIRVFVRDQKQIDSLSEFKGLDFAIGDLTDKEALSKAFTGVDKVYFICPNLSQFELSIGETLLDLGQKNKISRFVYHSVLHPQIEKMPHHWQKMRLEEAIFESNLNFSIIQPCAYMQNILGSWKSITQEGKYPVPYALSSRISIVDLMDVGIAAANVLMDEKYKNGIFELAGPEPLSQTEVAEKLSQALNITISAELINRKSWEQNVQSAGMNPLEISILLKMFEYYEKYNFTGSPYTLAQILGRNPTSLVQFLTRHISSLRSH